jgi:hypothetical protein
MMTNTENNAAEGTVVGANANAVQGKGTPSVRKSGLLSGRTAIALLIFFGLALSVAFPYGLGLVAFVALIVLTGALYAAGFASYALVKDMLSKRASFGFAPASAYMTGKKTKKRVAQGSPVGHRQEKQ